MVTLKGNLTAIKKPEQTHEEAEAQVDVTICSYCCDYGATDIPYDYCFKCGLTLCHICIEIHPQFKPENYWFSI